MLLLKLQVALTPKYRLVSAKYTSNSQVFVDQQRKFENYVLLQKVVFLLYIFTKITKTVQFFLQRIKTVACKFVL
ncbi:hypothetical protein N499_0467 [Wolbachia pipientis wVitA]|nr:hypothetical protein N499_0467 [Wolbachia pipientis wVitA]